MKKFNLNKFKGKKVVVTGHTGFKGGWLSFWLNLKGAKVVGISNKIITNPSFFKILKLNEKITNIRVDLRNLKKLNKVLNKHKPDFIFHLAAQAIVSKSYFDPVNTFKTNAIGTLNLLECIKNFKHHCVAVIITSDKSYRNIEIMRGYNENDILGGKDPYSGSKAAAENIIYSYFHSFIKKNKKLRIAIARAGNVIGGGDWSDNRLIPDAIRSIKSKKQLIVKSPNSTRPWLHVFEVLFGYMLLALKLKENKDLNGQAFNFGPGKSSSLTVKNLLDIIKEHFSNFDWKISKSKNFFESKLLKLNSQKSNKVLGWKNYLDYNKKIEFLTEWYKCYFKNPKHCILLSERQLVKFENLIKK